MTMISIIIPRAMEHMQKFPIAVRTYLSNSEQDKCQCEANHLIYKGENKNQKGAFWEPTD